MSMKPIKIGLVGCNRGTYLSPNFKLLGCEIVAICDFNKIQDPYIKLEVGQTLKIPVLSDISYKEV